MCLSSQLLEAVAEEGQWVCALRGENQNVVVGADDLEKFLDLTQDDKSAGKKAKRSRTSRAS